MRIRTSIENYHHGEYKDIWSSSNMKEYLYSPKRARYKKDNPVQKESNAMTLGTIFHDIMEELAGGETLDSKYIDFYAPVNPSSGKTYGTSTVKYQNAYNEALMSGKKPIDSEFKKEALLMGEAALNGECGKELKMFLEKGDPEISYIDNENKYKVRLDLELNTKIMDFKIIRPDRLTHKDIARQIINYRYDLSAAMYQKIVHDLTGIWKSFYWFFIEPEPPYDSIIVCADPWCYLVDQEADIVVTGRGAQDFNRIDEIHKKCININQWAGLSTISDPIHTGLKVSSIDVPAWHDNGIINFNI